MYVQFYVGSPKQKNYHLENEKFAYSILIGNLLWFTYNQT